MLFDDTFKTLKNNSEGIFRDKGSKFIAYAFPIAGETHVKEKIGKLKATHPKANHFCWAFRLSTNRAVFKLNDDGEPSGTAGRPILNTLLSADLTNVLVVVVRYFGGTLLGVPGLINAYKSAAAEAIKANAIVIETINDVYQLEFDYSLMNDVMTVVKNEQLKVLSQDFGTDCSLKIEVRKASLNAVLTKLEKIDGLKINYLLTK